MENLEACLIFMLITGTFCKRNIIDCDDFAIKTFFLFNERPDILHKYIGSLIIYWLAMNITNRMLILACYHYYWIEQYIQKVSG